MTLSLSTDHPFCLADLWHTVGVLRCVLESTMSKKSAAVGTGAIALSPLVDIVYLL
jgi:hypothetical protein